MAIFTKNKNQGAIANPGKQRLTLADIAQTGGSLTIRDVSPSLWFPAGQPVHPVAPAGTAPRRYAYAPITNINWSGRDGQVDFGTLRQFSYYPIIRLILETVKDKVCGIKWEFRLKQQVGETKAQYKKRTQADTRIAQVDAFFAKPDGWQNFRTWTRGLVDDMLVIDAASIWLQKDKKGKIASLVQIEGGQVFPLVDETGQQPAASPTASKSVLVQTTDKKADENYLGKVKGKVIGDEKTGTVQVVGGSPAFQLTPYGYPAQEMTADEFIYAVRNRLTYRKYGFSPIEQALAIIALGIGRLDFQAAFYKSGMGFEFIAFMPPDVPMAKVEEANGYLDSILSGNARNRRKGFFLPSYGNDKAPNIIFPKLNEQVLKDEFDEWLARVCCYALGVSPTAFIKSVNRATAEQQAESGEEEGLQPYIDWLGDLLNEIIQNHLGLTDIEAVPQVRQEQDALKQAQINASDFTNGLVSYNDLADRTGQDTIGDAWASMHIIKTPTGAFPLEMLNQMTVDDFKPKGNTPPATGDEGGDDGGMPPSGGKKKKVPPDYPSKKDGSSEGATASGTKTRKVAKLTSAEPGTDSRLYWPQMQHSNLTTNSTEARVRMENTLKACFAKAQETAILGVSGLIARPSDKCAACEGGDCTYPLHKAYQDPWSADYWNKIARQFVDMVPDITLALQTAAGSGVAQGSIQLGVDLPTANEQAAQQAADRAAEMVGMKLVDGVLVDNPDAQWAITNTTRDAIKSIIVRAFQNPTEREDVRHEIADQLYNDDAGIFSDARAEMIARTEIGRAQMGGTYKVWRESGQVTRLQWEAIGGDPCEECLSNDGEIVEFGTAFPSGAYTTMDSHPNCNCIVRAVGFK